MMQFQLLDSNMINNILKNKLSYAKRLLYILSII